MEATSSEDSGPEKQRYTMSEFMEYMSSDLLIPPSDADPPYVFWSQECHGPLPHPAPQPNSSSSSSTSQGAEAAAIQERIKQWLQSLNWIYLDSLLIQFWNPKIINGQSFLTTSQQPFALKTLYKGPCWYRKHCANHDILVEEGAGEEGIGPLGRAFLNGQPESSPDLRFYSVKECPLRDHALRCGLRRYMALPVFELQSNDCMGVLELVSFNSVLPLVYFELSQDAFKRSNLRLPHMEGLSETQTEGRKLAVCEIKQMFKAVNETPNIPLAVAWIPCQGCSRNCNCMQLAHYTCDPEWNKQYDLVENDFVQACLIHKLEEGKGIGGRALSSAHKLCFCRSIYSFSITEYPLAHYACKAMFSTCFAICLQSAHTGSDLYVLEFFMLPGNRDERDPRSLIHFLLERMTRQLLSFKVASGHKWGEELLLEILKFRMDEEALYFQKSPSDRYPLGFKVSALDSPAEAAEEQSRSSPSESDRYPYPPMEIAGGADHHVDSTANTLRAVAEETIASFERERKVASFQIRYEDLQSHFGKRQKEAANALGVSLSKFKRACRSHNILRWPSHMRNKGNHSLFEVKLPDKPGYDAGSTLSNVPSTSSIAVQDTKLVTIKANYQSKMVKFQVCTASGIAQLEEQVSKRLKLKIGDFEMSYVDEDGHSIFVTCDDDLCLCTNSLTSSTTIQLAVTPS